MRNDILKTISSQKDLTNVILLTFNIDLIFVETVLLRQLKRCGHPSLTILADAEEASRAFEAQGRWLSGIGRRYRVVPVRMEPGYRFHPKALLMSGTAGATVMVGSGNLTFGGFRQNEEIWTSFTSEGGDNGALASFREMLQACLERARISSGARRDIEEAYDNRTRPWAADLGAPTDVLWRANGQESLLAQMARVIAGDPVQRILVCSPYYDPQGAGLRELQTRWPDAELQLLVQSGKSTLTQMALQGASTPVELRAIRSSRQEGREAFVHAKFYAFYSGDQAVLFAGSANCSAAALLRDGLAGNSEMLAYRRLPAEDVAAQVLSELEVLSELPTIQAAPDRNEDEEGREGITVHRASYESGVLTVAFGGQAGLSVDTCVLDDEVVHLSAAVGPGHDIRLPRAGAPRSVRLEGSADGERVTSRSHWVDHEFVLSATSRQRKLAQSVESRISPATWSFGSWAEILRLLGDHLQYEPDWTKSGNRNSDKKDDEERVYKSADFFTDDYRLPRHRPAGLFRHEDERIFGLQRLLLEYFGIEREESIPETDEEPRGADEEVDRPEVVRKTPQRSLVQRKPLTEPEGKRAKRIAAKLVDQILDRDFLASRHQDLLAGDLTIVAVLLIAGWSEGWLTPQQFVELTYRVWTHLFFDTGCDQTQGNRTRGWMELREERTDDVDVFHSAVGTVSLSAALTLWACSCPKAAEPLEAARFALATRLAVARLPWLWNVSKLSDVFDEVSRIATRTGSLRDLGSGEWDRTVTRWDAMLREGRALWRMEHLLGKSIDEWRESVEWEELPAGTLLWQGKLGFGVLTTHVVRKAQSSGVPVLMLRATKSERSISPDYVMPARCLLQALSRDARGLPLEDVTALASFVAELEETLGRAH